MWVAMVLGAAWAGPAELDVERGRVALSLEQYDVARDYALSALEQSPNLGDAHQLYVDSTAAAGLGSRGLQELVTYDVQTPDWFATRDALEKALADDDWKSTRNLTENLLISWPGEPDLLEPLWSSDNAKVARLRARVLKALVHEDSLQVAEVESLYRLRRLLLEIGHDDQRALVEETLVDRGEEQPPSRPPLDRIQRGELALQLSKEQVPALPWGYPSELVDVVERLAATWAKAGRQRHTALAWQQLQRRSDDPNAWAGEAEAWLAAEEWDKGLRAANDAVARATHPRAVDLTAMNEERQRTALARALLARARINEGAGRVEAALADLGLATALAGHVLDDRLGERLDKITQLSAREVGGRYSGHGAPAELALRKAVSTSDEEQAVRHIDDALFLLAVGTRGASFIAQSPDQYVDLYATILQGLAEIEAENGRVDQARTAAVMATVLVGRSQPFWWSQRGEVQEKNGEYDAAFASFSIARGLGVPGLEDSLERTYVGLGTWEAAATQIGGLPPQKVAVKPSELVVSTHAPPKPRLASRPATAPRLGEAFPAFAVDTEFGKLSSRALEGRVIIMTFWSADCDECLQMLPSFGSLARRLRKEGRDTVLVAVSVDEDSEDFERVYRLGQRWGELVWSPALGKKFGADRLPSTWVVDRAGVARYYVDHWFSAEELESYVRDVE